MGTKKNQLTAVFIKDNASGGYTGFVQKYPAAVSQGKTLQDAKVNLQHALAVVLKAQVPVSHETANVN